MRVYIKICTASITVAQSEQKKRNVLGGYNSGAKLSTVALIELLVTKRMCDANNECVTRDRC